MEIDRLAQLLVAEAPEGATPVRLEHPTSRGRRMTLPDVKVTGREEYFRILPFAVSQLDQQHEGHRADDGGGCS